MENIELLLRNCELRCLLAELMGYMGACAKNSEGMSANATKDYHEKIQKLLTKGESQVVVS